MLNILRKCTGFLSSQLNDVRPTCTHELSLGEVPQLDALTVKRKGREKAAVAGSGLGVRVLGEWPTA